MTKEHDDKEFDIECSIIRLYNNIDITHRDSVFFKISRCLEKLKEKNVFSFFTSEGREPQPLGTINLENSVYAIDPCYEPGSRYSGKIDNVKPGIWHTFRKIGYCDDWGFRIAELIIRHEDYLEGDIEQLAEGVDVGVDSGQAGFFDAPYYEENKAKENEDEWYDRVSDITLGEKSAGTIDMKGVVASSGFGDGGYNLYTHEVDGKVVGMRIEFICQETLDEYYNEWLHPEPVNGGGS